MELVGKFSVVIEIMEDKDMKRGLVVSILVVIFMVAIMKFAMAGSYTISTTAEQDVILQKAATFYGITIEQVINSYKEEAIRNLEPKIEREKKMLLIQNYDGLTDTQKSQIEGIVNQ